MEDKKGSSFTALFCMADIFQLITINLLLSQKVTPAEELDFRGTSTKISTKACFYRQALLYLS